MSAEVGIVDRAFDASGKRLGFWTKTVERIGFPMGIALILLSIVLGVIICGVGGIVWFGREIAIPVTNRHILFVDQTAEAMATSAKTTAQLAELQRSTNKALWEINKRQDEHNETQREHATVIQRLADVLETGIKIRPPKPTAASETPIEGGN